MLAVTLASSSDVLACAVASRTAVVKSACVDAPAPNIGPCAHWIRRGRREQRGGACLRRTSAFGFANGDAKVNMTMPDRRS